jgi:hypothetical protein
MFNIDPVQVQKEIHKQTNELIRLLEQRAALDCPAVEVLDFDGLSPKEINAKIEAKRSDPNFKPESPECHALRYKIEAVEYLIAELTELYNEAKGIKKKLKLKPRMKTALAEFVLQSVDYGGKDFAEGCRQAANHFIDSNGKDFTGRSLENCLSQTPYRKPKKNDES